MANAADTRILAITVTDENPRMAQNIANQLRGAVAEQIQEVMRVDEVTVVEEANLPDRAARPSAFKNFAIGGVVGVFLAVAAVVLIFVRTTGSKPRKMWKNICSSAFWEQFLWLMRRAGRNP